MGRKLVKQLAEKKDLLLLPQHVETLAGCKRVRRHLNTLTQLWWDGKSEDVQELQSRLLTMLSAWLEIESSSNHQQKVWHADDVMPQVPGVQDKIERKEVSAINGDGCCDVSLPMLAVNLPESFDLTDGDDDDEESPPTGGTRSIELEYSCDWQRLQSAQLLQQQPIADGRDNELEDSTGGTGAEAAAVVAACEDDNSKDIEEVRDEGAPLGNVKTRKIETRQQRRRRPVQQVFTTGSGGGPEQ